MFYGGLVHFAGHISNNVIRCDKVSAIKMWQEMVGYSLVLAGHLSFEQEHGTIRMAECNKRKQIMAQLDNKSGTEISPI